LLRELTEEGYSYVSFDPEKSQAGWSIQNGKLYGGFDSIKGVGAKTAATLLALRAEHGADWLDELTDSQRDRITRPNNTPWDSLSYFSRTYPTLYSEPEKYRSKATPAGVSPPVFRIKDIPAHKGTFRFLGKIIRKTMKDANEASKVAKRGSKVKGPTTFYSLIFADDTDEIGVTINRFKVNEFSWLLESNLEGRDFLVKGEIIGDFRWIFADKIIELFPAGENSDVADSNQDDGRAGGAVSGAERQGTGDEAVRGDGDAAGRSADARTRRRKSQGVGAGAKRTRARSGSRQVGVRSRKK
jgi:hypothetical protein